MLEIKRLSLDDARLLIRGATKRANAIKVPMVIAVVDESGHLIAFERMDGGKILSTTLAVASDVVGGIGISGGAPEQDMDVAQAGIDHFLKTRATKKPARKK